MKGEKMERVVIESPYAADTEEGIDINEAYAVLKQVAIEAPINFPHAFQDLTPEQLEQWCMFYNRQNYDYITGKEFVTFVHKVDSLIIILVFKYTGGMYRLYGQAQSNTVDLMIDLSINEPSITVFPKEL